MTKNVNSKLETLARLEQTIKDRATSGGTSSYTSKLLSSGTSVCAKKFGEEAFELALATVAEDEAHVISEAGDVFYHLLVLLKSRDISLNQVMAELEKRTSQSGLEEKASRKNG